MEMQSFKINNIPSILWGDKTDKLFIAIHGSMSNKADTVIELFAKHAIPRGYQVLSFDLPEHGDRKDNLGYLCKVQNCVSDLTDIINYAKTHYREINIFACSIGAYFSLLAYKDDNISQTLFLSPIINMKVLIDNMMIWSNVTEDLLKQKQEIHTDFGQTLYYDYYEYVKNNPIKKWNSKTCILYGSNDNMQEKNIIKEFAETYSCDLEILENGEHFFHTTEQLDYFEKWLDRMI